MRAAMFGRWSGTVLAKMRHPGQARGRVMWARAGQYPFSSDQERHEMMKRILSMGAAFACWAAAAGLSPAQ
jgi:hypothetical protein